MPPVVAKVKGAPRSREREDTMLGDTLTVTAGGAGGTAYVLSKINQDAYSAEYLVRDATSEVRVKIRHSTESVKNGELYPLERHNLELKLTTFATPTVEEVVRYISYTMRAPANVTGASTGWWAAGISFLMTDAFATQLMEWES